jgi:iron complex outermembrane receptor protein
MEKYNSGSWLLEAGLRYDYRWLRAFQLNPNMPTLEEEPTYNWQDPTVNAGATFTINSHWAVDYNFGTAWRAPQVIELFADGIHQSAASWEIGDSSLTLERAYNNNLSFTYTSNNLRIEAGSYVNYFHHYIYAKPDITTSANAQGEVVYTPSLIQTVQGAFPVFTYTQVNALFEGLDLDVEYVFLKNFTLISKATLVRAHNLAIHDWLIDVPADKYDNTIRYDLPKVGRVTNLFFGISNLGVTKQWRVPPHSDFAPPPAGYDLWGAEVGCSVPFNNKTINVSLSATNLLNKAYRDYMNQFRYYVEDLGRNIALRVLVPLDWRKKPAGQAQ